MESNVEILHFSAHDKVGDPLTPELKSVVLVCGWESIRAHAGSFPGVTLFNKIGHL